MRTNPSIFLHFAIFSNFEEISNTFSFNLPGCFGCFWLSENNIVKFLLIFHHKLLLFFVFQASKYSRDCMFVCQTLFSHSKLYCIRSSFFRTWLADSVQFKQNGLFKFGKCRGNMDTESSKKVFLIIMSVMFSFQGSC